MERWTRTLRRLRGDERGGTLIFVALAMVMILGMTGLAVDLGRGYVVKSRLSRAVDSGVLAGARSLRSGQGTARQQALAVAETNGVVDGAGTTTTNLAFGINGNGESTVAMTARRIIPTTFMKILGQRQMTISAAATAAVPPVDMVLVLDQSGSLGAANAFDDLQLASKRFVGHFDDALDQMGLVSFQVRATDRFQMASNFTSPIRTAIDGLQSAGDTNTGEGLRLALAQLQSAAVRQQSARVVVFFTDGRPTAFRGMLGPGSRGQGGGQGQGNQLQDRVMAVYTTIEGRIRGSFDNPDALPTDALANPPDDCPNAPACWGWTEALVRSQARQDGLAMADQIRSQGIYIYTIGLGNPALSDPILQPDLQYLAQIANENGISDPSQPAGKSYFAPSAAQLQQVFDLVAQDLLVHLSQ